jgi:hypothetical protein
VSRYNFDKWPKSCLGCRRLIKGHWRSVAVQAVSEPEICQGAEFLCVAGARSGFITSYKAVLRAGAKAKLVTNLLILLSVLGGRSRFTIIFILI